MRVNKLQTKYHTGSALTDQKNRIVIEHIKQGSKVIELGCHTGELTKVLESKHCEVLGIDYDSKALEIASQRSNGTFLNISLDKGIPNQVNLDVDFILAIDILEHLQSPEVLLKQLSAGINSKCKLIAVGPNIAFWRTRFALFWGNWDYQDAGIMDRTHLHFFTKKTWIKLFEEAGFDVQFAIGINPFFPGRSLLNRISRRLTNKIEIITVKYFPTLIATQFFT